MQKSRFFFILVFFIFSKAWSLSAEKHNSLANEMYRLRTQTPTEKSLLKINSFSGQSNKKVGYGIFGSQSGAKGTFVISVGRTESSLKYYELAQDLIAQGYSPIFVLEHRGQGFSERFVSTDAGTVDLFSNYVEDMKQFINEIVLKTISDKQKLFLFAHSMGGGIAAAYLQKYDSPFNAIIYSSPMFKIKLPTDEKTIQIALEAICNKVVSLTGLCDQYTYEGLAYNSNLKFEENKTTSDKNQFQLEMYENELWPQIKLGSPTNRWILESIRATQSIRSSRFKRKIPSLLLQSQFDHYVENSAHAEVCHFDSDCQIVHFENAKHETFIEKDSIREKSLKTIYDFLNQF